MSKLEQPTKEQVLKAAEKRPCLKRGLKELWPGAFDKSVEMKGGIYADENGAAMAWLSTDKKTIILSNSHNWELTKPDVRTGCARLTHTRK